MRNLLKFSRLNKFGANHSRPNLIMPVIAPWKMRNQYRRVVFTVNLPDARDWGEYDVASVARDLESQFFIAGKETGEEGRKHFQGYFELKKKKQGSAIDKIFRRVFPLPISCHFEPSRGTADQNIEYCSKQDKSAFRQGEPLKQGSRNDLEGAMQAVAEGAEMVTVAETYPTTWAQYRRSLAEYALMKAQKRNWPTKTIYLWGPTGTGKTMHAQELNPTSVYWTGAFLNGFNGEKVLLFDDFDYSKMDWQVFLTMTDRYPMSINVKGGWANFAPEILIFTSNSNPKDWWPKAPDATRAAIHRRMDEYGDFKMLGELVPKETKLLDSYFKKKEDIPVRLDADATRAVASAPSRPPSPVAATQPLDIVILDSDSEDEYKESQDSEIERHAKRRIEELLESSDDE